MTPTRILGSVLLALALAACNRQGPDAPKPVSDKPADGLGEDAEGIGSRHGERAVIGDRDVARDILAEIVQNRLGNSDLATVFPDYTPIMQGVTKP